jgi:cytochrome P450
MAANANVPKFGSDRWFLDASPWYDLMRHYEPVFHDSSGGSWHVFKYADVERVLTQFSIFSSAGVGAGGYAEEPEEEMDGESHHNRRRGDSTEEVPQGTIMQSLLMTDPPIHTKLRNIVSRSFTPASISALEPRVKEITTSLLDESGSSLMRGVDFVSKFADPLPVTVIAEMLGIPTSDRRKFKQWSDNEIGSSEVDFATRMRTNLELSSYFAGIMEERKKSPRTDLISSIVTSEVDGEKLTMQEAVSFCILLLVAGNETTTNLLGNAIRLFAKYGTLQRLHDDPSLIPSAVEEVLRYSSPVRAMFRVAVKDSEISGKEVKRGDSLMAWIGSANRDEQKFQDPGRFDIERKPNPHIAFGHGIHMCLGAPLARLEANVALTILAERYRNVELGKKEELLRPIRNVAIGGVAELPVRFSS